MGSTFRPAGFNCSIFFLECSVSSIGTFFHTSSSFLVEDGIKGFFWITCAKMKTPPPPWFRILVDLTCLWPWQRHSWAPLQLVPVLCWKGQCSQSHLPAVLLCEPNACVSQQVTWCWHLVNPDGHQSVFGIFKPTIIGYHIGADMFGAKSQTGDVCHLGMTG